MLWIVSTARIRNEYEGDVVVIELMIDEAQKLTEASRPVVTPNYFVRLARNVILTGLTDLSPYLPKQLAPQQTHLPFVRVSLF